jgi:hypothetical protein
MRARPAVLLNSAPLHSGTEPAQDADHAHSDSSRSQEAYLSGAVNGALWHDSQGQPLTTVA